MHIIFLIFVVYAIVTPDARCYYFHGLLERVYTTAGCYTVAAAKESAAGHRVLSGGIYGGN